MIRTVVLFIKYVRAQKLEESNVFASCIMAMEQGSLHPDATNGSGETLGVVHLLYHPYFDSVLWDKYWALGPDVATFWSGMRSYADTKDILKNTPALWTDLGLVQRFAKKNSWLEGEVHGRIRASLRFAWIAAVVLQ
jgi:hypothetical protein